jgi:mono/diheme cytochrome c family protein
MRQSLLIQFMLKLRADYLTGAVLFLIALFSVIVCSSDEHASVTTQSGTETTSSRAPATLTFYRDVLPILRQHCQACHHRGGIAPMSFETYQDARRYANIIRNVTREKAMPPSFAIPLAGLVSNDPSLTAEQISELAAWANLKAPAGDPHDAPPVLTSAAPWSIPKPDLIVRMPQPVSVPADGDVDFTYEIVPTGFSKGRWVRMAQVLPSLPENVRQLVVFVRRRGSSWLRQAPVGKAFNSATLTNDLDRRWANDDILTVYAPGSSTDKWPAGMAKFIPPGADLIFRVQYITNGTAGADQSRVGLVFSKQKPPQRVVTLVLTNDKFIIPPGASDYRVEAHGVLGTDAVLLSLFPNMHLRGKGFEYDVIHTGNASSYEPEAQIEILLRVNYDLRWQTNYHLAEPRLLKAGTKLRVVGWYDNSPNNPHNPDPNASVKAGDQARDEILLGFLDVSVPASLGERSNLIHQQ